MIIKDMEPFQIVEKEGFIDLMNTLEKRYTIPSRKYFAERIIPEMHALVEESLAKLLDVEVAGNLSYTCDTWTTKNTTQSFFGITAHWIAPDFCRKSYILRCMPLDNRHTAEQLATHFLVALDTWKIGKARCHHVVRDNAANIAKCFRDLEISSSGCFAHSLPLALNDGILSQRYVTDMLAVSRRLVGHFKHSSSATARLHQFQAQLNMPNNQLVQDVSTRWNSSYYMMQRLLELECGPMPNVMVALTNTGGALCSTPQSLADAHY